MHSKCASTSPEVGVQKTAVRALLATTRMSSRGCSAKSSGPLRTTTALVAARPATMAGADEAFCTRTVANVRDSEGRS
eukprot:404536-Pleurochrysis_carterae.AAC.2